MRSIRSAKVEKKLKLGLFDRTLANGAFVAQVNGPLTAELVGKGYMLEPNARNMQ